MASRLDDDQPEEPPIDPVMARLQVKLRRLVLVSGGTLGLGLIAVLVAIVFRVSQLGKPEAPPDNWTSTIELPAAATLVATDVDGDRVAVTIEENGARRILVFDLATGRRIGEARLVGR